MSEQTMYSLKTINPYFEDVWTDKKSFELRSDGREFDVDDYLLLKEYHPDEGYRERVILAQITYILRDVPAFGLEDGYAILQFRVIEKKGGESHG